MRTRAQLALALLQSSRSQLIDNLRGITVSEALQAASGYRSILGILKHTASWSHVYHSYAFDAAPRHLNDLDWPRGLRDTVETSSDYFDEVVAWFDGSVELWNASLRGLLDEDLDQPRRCHWGATFPLFDILIMVASHWTYHAGEINEIEAIVRGEAWEYTEEVEENLISTAGHRVRPVWMTDEQAIRYEAHLARRDAELHQAS